MELVVLPNSLENQDDLFLQLQQQIEAKRELLMRKQKKIINVSKQNHFLNSVKNDYVKYNQYILQQKQEQMKALQLLDGYLHDLKKSGSLSTQNIRDAKEEQKKIIREMKSIRHNLDKMMKNTDDVSSALNQKTNY